MALVDVFTEAGLSLHEEGRLAEGLELLAHRLDYAGAGELVTAICGLEWTASKTDPKPVPTPKPPPPPKPPKG